MSVFAGRLTKAPSSSYCYVLVKFQFPYFGAGMLSIETTELVFKLVLNIVDDTQSDLAAKKKRVGLILLYISIYFPLKKRETTLYFILKYNGSVFM
jgi:hypothetical protein